jgi:hypothetical protein
MLHDLHGRKKYTNKGYVVVYYPEHPGAWRGCGLVYLHRLVMENHLNRVLAPQECVHHINGNIKNNSIRNLELLAQRAHNRKHGETKKTRLDLSCAFCSKVFHQKKGNMKYCSSECAHRGRRKVSRPSRGKLVHLIWKVPTSTLAKDLGVSDVAITKWCKQYGITKPPRGYWAKKRSKDVK